MSPVAATVLADAKLFHGMSDRQLSRFASAAHRVDFPPLRRIFGEGGRAERFWLIQEGMVAVDLLVPGRGTVTIETLRPGELLGWSWLFPPYEWVFGATAGEAAVAALEFDARLVRALCVADQELGHELYRRFSEVLVERLQATRLRLLDLYADPGAHP